MPRKDQTSRTIPELKVQQDKALAQAYLLREQIQQLIWLEEQYGSDEKLAAMDRRDRWQIFTIAGLIALYLSGQLTNILLS